MARLSDHPNEPGKWTQLERRGDVILWRRERSDPFPVTQFYLLAPPRQAHIVYDEALARDQFLILVLKDENRAA